VGEKAKGLLIVWHIYIILQQYSALLLSTGKMKLLCINYG